LSTLDTDNQNQKPTCQTCIYWGNSPAFSADDVKDDVYKPCGRIYNDKKSRHKKNQYPWEPEDFEENDRFARELLEEGHKAVVVDASGWFAVLKSNKEFGCVLHERK
jgi:hypothetical protein